MSGAECRPAEAWTGAKMARSVMPERLSAKGDGRRGVVAACPRRQHEVLVPQLGNETRGTMPAMPSLRFTRCRLHRVHLALDRPSP